MLSNKILANVCLFNRKKFSSELSIMPGAVHTLPLTTVTTNSIATGADGRSRLSSHRSDHEIHTPEHRNQQIARSPDMVLIHSIYLMRIWYLIIFHSTAVIEL